MLVVFQYIMNESLILDFPESLTHPEDIDFHPIISVDHRNRLIVEDELELVVNHHTELLNVELDKLSTRKINSNAFEILFKIVYLNKFSCFINSRNRMFIKIT
jgi:hypothetical protein